MNDEEEIKELFVQQAIANLSENKTVIMIAHRLRTITGAAQIFVLEQGRVKESGTHAKLLEQKGLYNKLFRLQNSIFSYLTPCQNTRIIHFDTKSE